MADQDHEVILEVLPDPRQVDAHRDALGAEVVGGADTGPHQDLRGLEGAGRDDDLALGAIRPRLAGLHAFHTHGAAMLEQQA
jgi:hypothetical protein